MANGFGGGEGKGHSHHGSASLANTADPPNIARKEAGEQLAAVEPMVEHSDKFVLPEVKQGEYGKRLAHWTGLFVVYLKVSF